MKKMIRDIQRCINRFEFVLLIYYDSDNDLGLHNIFTTLEELLKNDLVNTFKKYSVTSEENGFE